MVTVIFFVPSRVPPILWLSGELAWLVTVAQPGMCGIVHVLSPKHLNPKQLCPVLYVQDDGRIALSRRKPGTLGRPRVRMLRSGRNKKQRDKLLLLNWARE